MNEIPPYARLVAIGMAAASALGLVANHFMIGSLGTASLMILCLAPIALLLGIGGAVEPKVLWAMGKYGEHLPLQYKIAGGVLGVIGLLLALALVFLVYPAHFGMAGR
jgi:hypothetical protein